VASDKIEAATNAETTRNPRFMQLHPKSYERLLAFPKRVGLSPAVPDLRALVVQLS
jgi:hypothetical protein